MYRNTIDGVSFIYEVFCRFLTELFEETIERQANRLSKEVNSTDEKLFEICTIDIPM
ncbi:MAG: hypothetical protein ACFN1J_07225 [Bacteroidota bacterium]